jgi:dihydrofolate reductase
LKSARIVRSLDEIRAAKAEPGRAMHLVGGATLVGSMMNAGLVDEVRPTVHPLILGAGKALFKDVNSRRALELLRAAPLPSGQVGLRYRVAAI